MIATAEEPSDDIWRTRSRILRVGGLLLGAPEWIDTERGSSTSPSGPATASWFRTLVLSRHGGGGDARSIAVFAPSEADPDGETPPLLRDFVWHREQDKVRIGQRTPWPVTGIRFVRIADVERITRVTRTIVRRLVRALPEWNTDPWAPDADDAEKPTWSTLGFRLFTGRSEINGEWTASRPEHVPLLNLFDDARTALVAGSEPLGLDVRMESYDHGPDGERTADGRWTWNLRDPFRDV